METAALVAVAQCLAPVYGWPEHTPGGDPLGELIATILSQSTSDVNSQRAFRQVRAAFASWEAVRDAPQDDVAAAIRSGGLANLKAARIQSVLRALTATLPTNEETLDTRFAAWLRGLPVAEARVALQRLPGVGPKTAACVLLFALGQPSMPVDTHVLRVSQRLGLLGPRASVAQAHAAFDAATPADLVYQKWRQSALALRQGGEWHVAAATRPVPLHCGPPCARLCV